MTDGGPEGAAAGRGASGSAETKAAPPLAAGGGRPPMNKADAGHDEAAHTDAREDGQVQESSGPTRWTGETEPDREFREDPPTRGAPGNTAAPDAF